MEDDKNKPKPFVPHGHSLKSRRDFFMHGFLGLGAWVAAPSLLDVVSAHAQTRDCSLPSPTQGQTPVLIIDLMGGGNIAGANVMVGKTGGQLDYLNTYRQLGLPSDFHPNISGMVNHELGLAFHSDSLMLRGIQRHTTPATRQKVDGMIFCTSTNDDTINNALNPAFWLVNAGLTGNLVKMVGTHVAANGGYSLSPAESVAKNFSSVQITDPSSATSLIQLGRLSTHFSSSPDKLEKVLNKISSMSVSKLNAFSRRTLPQQILDIVSCGLIQPRDVVGGSFQVSDLDPLSDASLVSIFNLNSSSSDDSFIDKSFNPVTTTSFNTSTQRERRQQATIVKMLLENMAGVATIAIPGADYHDGVTANRGSQYSLKVGRLIGRTLAAFEAAGKNIMIHVITDGGVAVQDETVDLSAAGEGKFVWTSDSTHRSATFTLVYRHAGRIELRQNGRRQVGAYLDEVASNDIKASLISNSPVNCAKALVANYLALSEQEHLLPNVVGNNPFNRGTAIYEDYLIFRKV